MLEAPQDEMQASHIEVNIDDLMQQANTRNTLADLDQLDFNFLHVRESAAMIRQTDISQNMLGQSMIIKPFSRAPSEKKIVEKVENTT